MILFHNLRFKIQRNIINNQSIEGKKVIFYFYPKDDTPGCTKEGQDFSGNLKKFEEKGIIVYGVSKCSVKKHENFVPNIHFNMSY